MTEHTTNVIRAMMSRRPIRLCMVMVKLLRRSQSETAAGRMETGRRGHCWWRRTTGSSQVVTSMLDSSLAVVHLGHASNPPTPQSWILVTVAPTINSPLNETSFTPQTRIQLSQSPANRIALRLVDQSVPPVLILWTARSRIYTVVSLEIRAQSLDVDVFYVAADGVLHLDAVPRILERDPLHAVAVLAHHQRGSCRNGARGSSCVCRSGVGARMGVRGCYRRSGRWWVSRSQRRPLR